MAEESPQSAHPARPARHLSMVPLHSSYPRAPYATQKNAPRTPLRRSPKAPPSTQAEQELHASMPAQPGVGAQGTSTVPPTGQAPASSAVTPPYGYGGQPGQGQRPSQQPRSSRGTGSGTPVPPMAPPPHAAQLPASHAAPPPSPIQGGPSIQEGPVNHRGTQLPPPQPDPSLHLPPGAVLAPGMPPLPQQPDATRRRRKPQQGPLDSAQKRTKIRNTTVMIMAIIVFFTSILPRIVEALNPDESESFIETLSEESDEGIEPNIKPFAEPPVPIPLGPSTKLGPTIPPEESGSSATPARAGERLVIKDVAMTVNAIERGEDAARAAWNTPPPGYEYVLVRLEYENPDGLPISFSPILVNDKNDGYYPETLSKGKDFRYEVQPDENGVMIGDVLFLVKSDELYTLMLQSYDENYPVVFYALP